MKIYSINPILVMAACRGINPFDFFLLVIPDFFGSRLDGKDTVGGIPSPLVSFLCKFNMGREARERQ